MIGGYYSEVEINIEQVTTYQKYSIILNKMQ